MELDDNICERARLTRDPRFDGRFFVGVLSTGIYCRPVCPAPPARRRNVKYFPSAAAAREAGLRPCLRCRPESAPGSPAWAGTGATVCRALRLIEQGALDHDSVGALAARLGIGERYLRKLFAAQLGASPLSVALTQRIHFAKQLLDETSLSMADIALASGFGSSRRFNAVFRQVYGKAPSELRRSAAEQSRDRCTLLLRYREPLSWSQFQEHYAARALAGVEAVGDGRYTRTVRLPTYAGWIDVRPRAGDSCLELTIGNPRPDVLAHIVSRVRRMFDLDSDPAEIGRHLAGDSMLLKRLSSSAPPRLPGAFDPFEQAVRAIMGQQVSVRAASTIAARLVSRCNRRLDCAPAQGPALLFPTAQEVAELDLHGMGMPPKRAATLRAFAKATHEGRISLDGSVPTDEVLDAIRAIPGIGEWTAQYIALRALGDPDAFPAQDLGILKSSLWGTQRPAPREVRARAEAWRPWRAYAAILLWQAYP